ncbi:MAG: hypothetical protein Q4C73_10960 [Eubacteriales bacterium]|nr:hypothetical protein [Eubacteriales bacterium]
MVMKKRQAAAVFAAAGLAAALAGCGQKAAAEGWKANENSIYVTKDGQVESAMIYTAEKANDLYTREGLEAFARDAVSAYNEEQGAEAASENTEGEERLPAALKSCSLEGQTGTLVFEYGSPEDFVEFSMENGDNTHSITGLKAGAAGELSDSFPDISVLTAAGKDAGFALTGSADQEAVSRLKGCQAVITEGAGTVYVEGEIVYVTSGVTVKAANAAVMPEGAGCIFFQ